MQDNIAGSSIRWGSKFPFFMSPNTIFDQEIIVTANERIKGQGKPSIVKREIRAVEKLVYLYLARCCSNDAAQGFPSYETIARKCGISRWAAIHAVDTLSRAGLLVKQLRKKGRVNETNIYELLHPEDLSQADPKGGSVLSTLGQCAEHTHKKKEL
jgi:biotin operon repressor